MANTSCNNKRHNLCPKIIVVNSTFIMQFTPFCFYCVLLFIQQLQQKYKNLIQIERFSLQYVKSDFKDSCFCSQSLESLQDYFDYIQKIQNTSNFLFQALLITTCSFLNTLYQSCIHIIISCPWASCPYMWLERIH